MAAGSIDKYQLALIAVHDAAYRVASCLRHRAYNSYIGAAEEVNQSGFSRRRAAHQCNKRGFLLRQGGFIHERIIAEKAKVLKQGRGPSFNIYENIHEKCLTIHENFSIIYSGGGKMAILQVRDIDDKLYDSLKHKAKTENRSISQEIISILETYLSNPESFNTNFTREFLNLSWEDNRDAVTIITDIATDRRNKKSFGEFLWHI